MPRSRRFAFIVAGLALALFSGPAARGSDDFTFYHENVLGTSLELLVRAESANAAGRAEHRILAEIDRLAAIFSGYDRGSEFSRWQAAPMTTVSVSRELHDVLAASDYWRIVSGGAFDPRVEVLSRLWSQCASKRRLPVHDESAAAAALLGAPAWELGPGPLTARRLSDCPLSFDGIAKGFIVERACDLAIDNSPEVRGLLLNLGGDLRVRSPGAMTIGVADPAADSESSEPAAYIEVKNRSVATSGRSRRGFQIDGKWYSHVFDPRSGLPVERVSSATVVALRGVDADALAKVCSVLEPDASLRLVESLAGAACRIVLADGQVVRSAGWNERERPRPILLAQAARADQPPAPASSADLPPKAEPKPTPRPAWNKEFELIVNLEINHPEAEKGRYRRPFVAVWVEDTAGKQVRTLALWVSMGGSGPFQWLPDLKRWYKSDTERQIAEKKDIFFTVSRPTRPPGKYKLIWDGKDNHGKQMGGGDYTILIDAAREHGTYQYIRQEVSLSNKPWSEDLKGNVEIRSASIEYRRKVAAK